MPILMLALLVAIVPTPTPLTLKIDDVDREALVYTPAMTDAAAPLVFAFHGHGGNKQSAARSFRIHELWPEAVVVYPQGLPTSTPNDPQGRRNGWQHAKGEQQDRDLKFFDALLAHIKDKHKIDPTRIYVMGHSNGGIHTYLLWATYSDLFAAAAPSGAPAGRSLPNLKPLPCLHTAGEKDPIVPFANQQRTMDFVRKLNECQAVGEPWAKVGTRYSSPKGTPFVAYVHPGGHANPADTSEMIVRFFKEHARKPSP